MVPGSSTQAFYPSDQVPSRFDFNALKFPPGIHSDTFRGESSYDRLSGTTLGTASNESSIVFGDPNRLKLSSAEYGPPYNVISHNWQGRPFSDFAPTERTESPEPLEKNKSQSNRGSPKRSKLNRFVIESGKEPTSDGESKRSKRKGELSNRARSKAGRVREIGACWRCRSMKQQVSNWRHVLLTSRAADFVKCGTEMPCEGCRRSGKFTSLPCFRGPFKDSVAIIFPGLASMLLYELTHANILSIQALVTSKISSLETTKVYSVFSPKSSSKMFAASREMTC